MAENTRIEWADATWNPWIGCRRVSTGCANCYAAREMKRFGRDFDQVVRTKTLRDPWKWRDEPKHIFTCSWSDFFIAEADEWRPDAWETIRRSPEHTYLILTKRPGRIPMCLPDDWGDGWEHVWLGTSAENQRWLDKRAPALGGFPAKHLFLSAEPLLGPLDLYDWLPCGDPTCEHVSLHWVVVGGESGGPNARPCDQGWIRSIIAQCREAGVPAFCKQLGANSVTEYYDEEMRNLYEERGLAWPDPIGWHPRDGQPPVGSRVRLAFHDPKAADPAEWPLDLRVREKP